MSGSAARNIAFLQKFKFIRCSSVGFMQPKFEVPMREDTTSTSGWATLGSDCVNIQFHEYFSEVHEVSGQQGR